MKIFNESFTFKNNCSRYMSKINYANAKVLLK